MDIKQLVTSKSSFEAAAAAAANGAQATYFPKPETGPERSNGTPNNMGYPSPTTMQNPLPMTQQLYRSDNGFDNGMIQQGNNEGPKRQASGDGNTQKAFPCPTCGKGFARRSDLARHKRIHSGVRPHVCDHPGCDKRFIQRSGLTVHQRVHTGEKPHMCERCGKPFSDSSSLARHRRIHSGTRPYKCPYADCQKTFTRRTTLTRHQNHHTGTVEEAAAATAAALATRSNREWRQYSDGEQYSNNSSPISTPPNFELPLMNNMHRHPGAGEHNSLLSHYQPPTSYPRPAAYS